MKPTPLTPSRREWGLVTCLLEKQRSLKAIVMRMICAYTGRNFGCLRTCQLVYLRLIMIRMVL